MKSRVSFLIFFLLIPLVICKANENHAVLVSADGPIPSSAEVFFTQPGERVAVKAGDVWVVRAGQQTLDAIKASGLPVTVIDTESGVNEFVAGNPSYSWILHLFTKPESDPEAGSLEIIDMTAPAAIPDDSETDIRSLLKSAADSRLDPNITSDVLAGSTVVAVFYVNHHMPGIPGWTSELSAKAHANILLNLVYWSDQAQAYGKLKTFTVKPFWPDDPRCTVGFDPTDGAQVSYSANDSKIANAIMTNMGYTEGRTHTARMRAYCNDLRAAESTDWAYIAFLLTGKYSVRAHASFGGPSTVLMASQAANSYIFAHETGHIFNAFDEYFEEGRSLSRSRQSRFGIPNGNHRFRNHPLMPSMMSGSFRGLSGYTAAHLGLIDTLRLFRVEVSPASAIYEVGYIPMYGDETDAGFFSRYQGVLDFAWGNGMKVVLRGLPEISHEGQRYSNASWEGGASEVILEISDNTPAKISLSYSNDGTSKSISMEYLTVKNALASEFVRDIAVIGNREAIFAGDKGISYWADGTMTILDYPLTTSTGIPGRDTVYRICHSIASGTQDTWLFSSQSGEVLFWSSDGLNNNLRGPDRSLLYYTVAATGNGDVYATDGGIVGGREMRGSGLHRFSNNQTFIYTSNNSILPGNSISGIASGPQNKIWLGYAGTAPDPQGLFLFDPPTNTITNYTQKLSYPLIVRLRKAGNDGILAVSRNANPGANVTVLSAVDLILPDTVISYSSELFNPVGRVNDAAFLPDGRLVVATHQGVGVLDSEQENLIHFHRGNSELISDNCFSIATAPNGHVYVGTVEGAVIITGIYIETSTNGSKGIIPPDLIQLDQNYPNPFNSSTTISWHSGIAGQTNIDVYDITGRKVKVLVNEYYPPGRHEVNFEDNTLTPGIYYYQLQMGNFRKTGKMIVTK